jgi:hypothetical protein
VVERQFQSIKLAIIKNALEITINSDGVKFTKHLVRHLFQTFRYWLKNDAPIDASTFIDVVYAARAFTPEELIPIPIK